jgi:multicomponent Na+:H+ antiporter subunit E
MPLVLLLLWIVFNGRITGDVLVSGVFGTLLVSVFCHRYMGYRMRNDRVMLKKAGKLIRYFLLLIREMIIANIHVIGIVLSPKIKIRPCIIHFQSDIESVFGRVLLANTITLIPGSVTCVLTDEGYIVHALTPEIAKAQQGSAFEKYILEMERDD